MRMQEIFKDIKAQQIEFEQKYLSLFASKSALTKGRAKLKAMSYQNRISAR